MVPLSIRSDIRVRSVQHDLSSHFNFIYITFCQRHATAWRFLHSCYFNSIPFSCARAILSPFRFHSFTITTQIAHDRCQRWTFAWNQPTTMTLFFFEKSKYIRMGAGMVGRGINKASFTLDCLFCANKFYSDIRTVAKLNGERRRRRRRQRLGCGGRGAGGEW